jgi:hypothetical protein
MMGMDYAYLAVEKMTSGYRVIMTSCGNANSAGKEVEEASVAYANSSILLRVQVAPGAICHFSYSRDGKQFTALGESFIARAGRWIGAKVGLFCLAPAGAQTQGYADFDWFRFD